MRAADELEEATARGVRPWRFALGALVHFLLPGYLVAVIVAALAGGSAPSDFGGLVERALWTAPRYLLAFALLAALIGAWGAVDGRRERARRLRFEASPAGRARRSESEFVRALAVLENGGARDGVARLRAAPRDYADPRVQAITDDLAAAAERFAAAPAGAETARLADDSAARLASALEEIAAERARLDRGDARTMAGYLAAKYPDALR